MIILTYLLLPVKLTIYFQLIQLKIKYQFLEYTQDLHIGNSKVSSTLLSPT